jgi:hypothetical protein
MLEYYPGMKRKKEELALFQGKTEENDIYNNVQVRKEMKESLDDYMPLQQSQENVQGEPNFDNFNFNFEKPLELNDKKQGVNKEIQTNNEENFQIVSLGITSL